MAWCYKKFMKNLTTKQIAQLKGGDRRISMLTCYDATFARLLDQHTAVDMILIGDSLGMVIQGNDSTIPVTIDDVTYHTRAVARHAKRAHIVGDMPYLSYQINSDEAIRNAGALLRAGAQSVKLEGGVPMAATVRRLVEVGIPVIGHIGLMGQSHNTLGGHVLQGKTDEAKAQLLEDAQALQDAGAYALLVECVPENVAREITASIRIPTIGIGSGIHCDGQVLVLYDLLDLNPEFRPRFVKQYMNGADAVTKACQAYVNDVQQGIFPGPEHTYGVKQKTSGCRI